MGLDMYLHRKVYVKNWSHNDEVNKVVVKRKENKDDTFKVHPMFKGRKTTITNIEEEIMYWRKANAIHQWFVENVQGGTDDCGTYDVELDELKTLLRLVDEVLDDKVLDGNSKAEKLLPIASRFFFGGTEYDKWYFNDLKNTKEALEKIIVEHVTAVENGMKIWDITYQYRSSW